MMDDAAKAIPSNAIERLAKFDSEANDRIGEFVTELEARPPPKSLYHYTNDTGLRGILETGRLWLADIFDLNDPSELQHGFSHVCRLLGEKARGKPGSALEHFAELFEAMRTNGGLAAAAHYFVCSFSAEGDDLGQWRAYSDNGRGFVSEFDTAELEGAFVREPHNNTFRVGYDESVLIGLHRRLVDDVVPLIELPAGPDWPREKPDQFSTLESVAIRAFMAELSSLAALHAVRAALFFKHSAYRNEAEYRFLQLHASGPIDPPPVLYRSRPYALARYREFDWGASTRDALRRIIVGPAASDRAHEFASDCLRAFHKGNVEITCSEIPYRVR